MKCKLFAGPAVLAVLAVAAVMLVQPATSSSNKIVASATGSGHLTTGGELRTFSFSAHKYADGTVTGEMQVNNRQQGTVTHHKISCLVVSGNKAYAGTTIDSSSDAGFVGVQSIFEVRDNGEGKNAPADQATLFWYGGGITAASCANAGWQAFLDSVLLTVEHGNVQVH
jgi:hypothetical protein